MNALEALLFLPAALMPSAAPFASACASASAA
jgi:hypothetical protein